jgi:hypothetical protein
LKPPSNNSILFQYHIPGKIGTSERNERHNRVLAGFMGTCWDKL